jgi:hypothetical protein
MGEVDVLFGYDESMGSRIRDERSYEELAREAREEEGGDSLQVESFLHSKPCSGCLACLGPLSISPALLLVPLALCRV